MKIIGKRPYMHNPNTIHHVMVRGNNRQCVFYGKKYFQRFLEIVEQSTEKFDHKILSYCLMTNHIHFIIRINQSSLSFVMKNINYRYARWFNKVENKIGHLFQGRYRSIEVQDEAYLINLCRYIHLNPVMAKIVSDPHDYFWCSHKNYITNSSEKWLDCNFIVDVIQDKTGMSYFYFMQKPLEKEKWKPIFYLSEDGEFVIDDAVKEFNGDIICALPRERFLEKNHVASIVCKHLS